MSSEHPQHTSNDDETVGGDKLRGAIAIGAEIDEPPHRVYRLWSLGRLSGVYKDGNALIGSSKSALRRAHHNRARSGK